MYDNSKFIDIQQGLTEDEYLDIMREWRYGPGFTIKPITMHSKQQYKVDCLYVF